MDLLIVTDAWSPQVNGVVRTLTQMQNGLRARGWNVRVLGPSGLTMPCPTYPEIRLTLEPTRAAIDALREEIPEAIHIATEGPLGRSMRRLCMLNDWPFTTSFHTRFPEYLKARFALPRRWTYSYLREFHRTSERVLVPTPSVRNELNARGFSRVELWGRGVDLELFHPSRRRALPFDGPIQLYVGRLAIEKNLAAFLELETTGTKLVVGDGPERARLQRRFANAVFLGPLYGEQLAEMYASADVLVFPSRTDTFGLVMLEALACGTPVAALPATGSGDLLAGSTAGVIDEDLGRAISQALALPRGYCRTFAEERGWNRSVDSFERALVRRRVNQFQGSWSPSSGAGARFNWGSPF